MSAAHARARSLAALAVGATFGAAGSAGTALLLYTGQGFLRAAGLLVASMLMAVAAGLWAGAPEPGDRLDTPTRSRWVLLSMALITGGIFSGVWNSYTPLREHGLGGALAVLLQLALPAYAAGSLFAALHARDRAHLRGGGAVAAGAIAGSAIGVLLATTLFIQTVDPYGIYFGAAILVAITSVLDRARTMPHNTGVNAMIDRVVIVTGAGEPGQLGHAIAQRLLDAGARVVISARSDVQQSAAALAARGVVLAVQADLTRDEDVAALIAQTRARFGRIDALINVAGGLSVIATVENTTPAEWQREIERNAGTALRVTRAALPLLRESRGAIVNFAAPAALRAPAQLAAYAAAKAAVVALTRALAIEEKTNGVRANAIAPGLMDTDQNRATMGDDATYVTRADVAAVAVFLAGPAAAGITGETVQVLGPTIA